MPSLENLRCLVIGGRSGLGAAIVTRLLADGVNCHVTSRRPVAGLPSTVGDVREPADIIRMVEQAADSLDGLDVVLYCAGVAAVGPVEDLTPAQWTEIFETNTRGFGLAVQAALPHWRAGGTIGAGCAIALSSQAALRGQSLISAYTASKAAVDGLVRALAVELAPLVRVNAVAPGIVPTDMIAEDFARQAARDRVPVESVKERSLARIPLGRFQRAESVAAAVAFLLSPAGRDITGQTLVVDGGMTA